MEQLIAQNKSRLLPEDFREGVKLLRSRFWKWIVCIFAAVIIFTSLLLYYYQGLLEVPNFWPLVGIGTGIFFLVADFFLFPRVAGRLWYLKTREDFEIAGTEELRLRFSVWNDRIEVSAKHGRTVTLFFRDLKRQFSTKLMLAMKFSNHSILMLTDSFLEGDAGLVQQAVERG